MGYCISYNPELKEKYPPIQKRGRKKWGAVLFAIMLFSLLFKDVRLTVKDWLLPGDAAVTEAALTDMIHQVQSDTPFKEALTMFCLTIIEGAQNQDETVYSN